MDPSRLLGAWEFRREVRDHLDGTEYAASGTATFTADGDGRIRWAEKGTLRWADRSTPVSRLLFLVRERPDATPGNGRQRAGRAGSESARDDGAGDGHAHDDDTGADGVAGYTGAANATGDWRVTFEDGRDFHPWTARPVEHACGHDLYEGHVETKPATGLPRTTTAPAGGRTTTDAGTDAGWTIRWRVTGPAKDYTMLSHYSRATRTST